MTETCSKHRLISGSVFLAILCFCVYSAVLSNQFVSFDDGHYIFDNQFVKRGLTADSIRWAFSFHEKSGSYWHPLTWLSLMLDYQFFGLNPSWFHLVNLLLHALSVILLFLALYSMTDRFERSVFIAALFAIHPLNVESVAWAAERKTVLCGLFFMLSILFYARYVKKPSPQRYLLVCLAFILGLMAKSMIVSLPIMLFLLDIWPLGRFAGVALSTPSAPKRSVTWLILEKTPLCILSFAAVAISIYSLRGTYILDERNLLPFGHKVANALISYPLYLCKIIWPTDLAVYYPVRLHLPPWQIIISFIVILLFSIASIRSLKKIPWFFVGWFWFLIAMLPTIGLIRRGLWPAFADRFAYLPMIGISILLVWGTLEIFEKYAVDIKIRYCCTVTILLFFALLCHRQVSFWRDGGTLFQQAVKVTRDNDIALANLGWYRFSEGRQQEALDLLKQIPLIDPFKPDFEYASGVLEFNKQHYVAAAVWFEKALKRSEKHLASLFFLGLAYERSGEMDQAARVYTYLSDTRGLDPAQYRNKGAYCLREKVQPALALKIRKLEELARHSGSPVFQKNHADALYRAGLWQSARAEYLSIPENCFNDELLLHLADCERRLGYSDNAMSTLRLLLKSQTKKCNAAVLLGQMSMENGHWEEARQIFETVLNGGADCQEAEFGRAYCFYAAGKRCEALAAFQSIRTNNPDLHFKASQYSKRLQAF